MNFELVTEFEKKIAEDPAKIPEKIKETEI